VDVILRDILVFLQSGNIWRHVLDLIDVTLVAFFLYRLFLLVRGTQAVQLMFGVLLLALIGLLANLLDLRLLSWIFRNAAPAVLIGIIVLFQPEIRRALDQFGRIGFIGRPMAHYNLQIFNRMIDEVIRATTKLTQRFTGALIVFEKETGLENYANSGIRINGELTSTTAPSSSVGTRSWRRGASFLWRRKEPSGSGWERATEPGSACRCRRTRLS